MAGIFISYRRVDTVAWASRVFEDLTKRFDVSQVFMDINGGIPRGAQFPQVIKEALSGCDVLLALIGPEWCRCKRSDGCRRLELLDDWVRNEIATALAGEALVVPVLLGKAAFPEEDCLPKDLLPLRDRQEAEITDNRWNYDMGELIKDLLKRKPTLKPAADDDVDFAINGILLLRDHLLKSRVVADAVSRSKEVIENTHRQVGKLRLFKNLHDALHRIEQDCLQPLQQSGTAGRIRPFKIRFITEESSIREAIRGSAINPALHDDLQEHLDCARVAFHEAEDSRENDTHVRLLSELNALLSSLPARLDQGIGDAATEIKLDRLVALMTTVQAKLAATISERNSEFAPFVQGVNGVKRLSGELDRRVKEHTQLQRLDSKLRAVCVGKTVEGSVASEWKRIKLARERLAPPFSVEMEAVHEDLVKIEADIESAVALGRELAALGFLNDYFMSVGSVFRSVDNRLKDFCMRLSEVNDPLKTVLDLCSGNALPGPSATSE